MQLSIIIPVMNEADNVRRLYQEINTALLNYQFEVIFVDDGSTDGSAQCLRQLSSEFSNINVVTHKQNYGQSAALLSGSLVAHYETLVTLDGDGQNDPLDIPKLMSMVNSPQCVVVGRRLKRDDSLIRKFSSKVAKTVLKLILQDPSADTGCSLKLFPRDAFLRLPHFNHHHRFMPILFKRAGFSIINVDVNHRARVYGQSKYGMMNRLWVGIVDVLGVWWLLRRPCNPELKT